MWGREPRRLNNCVTHCRFFSIPSAASRLFPRRSCLWVCSLMWWWSLISDTRDYILNRFRPEWHNVGKLTSTPTWFWPCPSAEMHHSSLVHFSDRSFHNVKGFDLIGSLYFHVYTIVFSGNIFKHYNKISILDEGTVTGIKKMLPF